MKFTENIISKEDFFKINEDDVMFITNPGRMGDEDGVTFIVRKDNEFKIYRLSEWMYRGKDFDESEHISLNDASKQFPIWYEAWKNEGNNKKYKYLYMGFGNGLCVDHSIYSEFEPYLNDLVEKYLKKRTDMDKESLKYAAIFDVWEDAFINMVNDKGYILR